MRHFGRFRKLNSRSEPQLSKADPVWGPQVPDTAWPEAALGPGESGPPSGPDSRIEALDQEEWGGSGLRWEPRLKELGPRLSSWGWAASLSRSEPGHPQPSDWDPGGSIQVLRREVWGWPEGFGGWPGGFGAHLEVSRTQPAVGADMC